MSTTRDGIKDSQQINEEGNNRRHPVAPELDEQIEQYSRGWLDKFQNLAEVTHGDQLLQIDLMSQKITEAKGLPFNPEAQRSPDEILLRDVIMCLNYVQYQAPRFLDAYCRLAKAAKDGELLMAQVEAEKTNG